MHGAPVGRRRFLQGAGAALAIAGVPLIEGCSSRAGQNQADESTASASAGSSTSSPGSSGGPSGAAGGPLPAFVPSDIVTPDLPASDNGTPAAFYRYPASPVLAHPDPPLSGGSVSALKMVDNRIPPPVNKNPFWQELNKRIGGELKLNNIISSDYSAKVATITAGGDLPDLLQMSVSYVQHAAEWLSSECQDLSPWLSGRAVEKYPCLAAVPSVSWRNVVFNGGIYGIPFPLGVVGGDTKIRQDVVDGLGVGTQLSDGQEFLDLCKSLTDQSKRRWAVARINDAQAMVNEMVGVANGYQVVDGEFTNAIQTDEYKTALDICSQMWKAGYIYPDSVASVSDYHQWFIAGQALIMHDGYTNWPSLTTAGVSADPKFRMGGLTLPKWEGGGQAAHFTGSGMYTFTVLKKASPARIEELLRLLDWLASPFGTVEYLFKKYGVAGRDYELNGTDPAETETGINEVQSMNLAYLANGIESLYIAGNPDLVKVQHEYLTQLMVETVPLPTVGLVSETALAKGSSLNKALTSAVTDVVVGRKKVSDWDGVVTTYLSGGGSQINSEYSEAYAKSATG